MVKGWFLAFWLVAVLVAGCGGGDNLSPTGLEEITPRYFRVVDLSDKFAGANEINNRGDILGITKDRKVILVHDGITSVIAEDVRFTGASALNNHGQVVGGYITPPDAPQPPGPRETRAFLWQDGVLQDLGITGGHTTAKDINDSGQIIVEVEILGTNGAGRELLWDNGVVTDVGTPGTLFGGLSQINNRGQILGNQGGIPTLWENGQARPVGDGYLVGVLGINDEGTLLMSRYDPQEKRGYLFFLLSSGEEISITTSSDTPKLNPVTFNNRNQIIGNPNSVGLIGDEQPFEPCYLYSEGKIYDLNQMIPQNPGWLLTLVQDINDRGEILCRAEYQGDPRQVLLTPVFEDE